MHARRSRTPELELTKRDSMMTLTPKPIILAAIIATGLATMQTAASAAPADCVAQQAAGQPCPPDAVPVAPAVTPPAAAAPVAPAVPPAAANPPAAAPPPPAANNTNQQPPAAGNRPPRDQASNFQFDPDRHNRRRGRNDLFRFFFNGYYYDRPYWQQGYYQPSNSRISCGEGRRIVADDDFSRIRTVECNGITYTYQARRGSHTYRVFVNSRRGVISGTTRLY
jgi:hypothetical protein